MTPSTRGIQVTDPEHSVLQTAHICSTGVLYSEVVSNRKLTAHVKAAG
jgi:hypothetical protein